MDRNIYKLYKGIKEDIKHSEDYHTGLVGEALIIAAYKQQPIEILEKYRFILTKIIRKKKEMKRVNDSIHPSCADSGGNSNIKK